MRNQVFITFVALSGFAQLAFAHKGHHQEQKASADQSIEAKKNRESNLKAIGEQYTKNIQPIFNKKCMDCHSLKTTYPWYYQLPGIKQVIDSDIKEGREHLDFTEGFPFKSHASPEEDLIALRDSIKDGSMPPFSYRLMHPGAALRDDERKTILEWIDLAND